MFLEARFWETTESGLDSLTFFVQYKLNDGKRNLYISLSLTAS